MARGKEEKIHPTSEDTWKSTSASALIVVLDSEFPGRGASQTASEIS